MSLYLPVVTDEPDRLMLAKMVWSYYTRWNEGGGAPTREEMGDLVVLASAMQMQPAKLSVEMWHPLWRTVFKTRRPGGGAPVEPVYKHTFDPAAALHALPDLFIYALFDEGEAVPNPPPSTLPDWWQDYDRQDVLILPREPIEMLPDWLNIGVEDYKRKYTTTFTSTSDNFVEVTIVEGSETFTGADTLEEVALRHLFGAYDGLVGDLGGRYDQEERTRAAIGGIEGFSAAFEQHGYVQEAQDLAAIAQRLEGEMEQVEDDENAFETWIEIEDEAVDVINELLPPGLFCGSNEGDGSLGIWASDPWW